MEVGDRVRVAEGFNSRNAERNDVTGVILGFRGPIVVVNRDEPGRYFGEGVWAFTSDVLVLVDMAKAPHFSANPENLARLPGARRVELSGAGQRAVERRHGLPRLNARYYGPLTDYTYLD